MTTQTLKLFLIAGEASGDSIGASFMQAFKKLNPNVEFSGIGGALMQQEGMKSLFPMEELSVMGLVEVLPKALHILSRIKQTADNIVETKPDAVLTIDSPDFSFRVIKKLKKKNTDTPCIHYVAPTVWAWRAGRAKKVSKFLDHLLALFPFEPPYFQKHGLNTTFVGHPIVEKCLPDYSFKEKYNITDNKSLICVLPGSRHGEIEKLEPVFNEVIAQLDATIVIPTLPHLKEKVGKLFPSAMVIESYEDKFACFKESSVAIAASGTVSLELALTQTPHVIAYRVSSVTAFLAKLLLKTKFANLINIILNKPVVPELLQEDCNAKAIVANVSSLLEDSQKREGQLHAFKNALSQIGQGAEHTPGEKAAKAVLTVIQKEEAYRG